MRWLCKIIGHKQRSRALWSFANNTFVARCKRCDQMVTFK